MNVVTPIREEAPSLFSTEAEQMLLGALMLNPDRATLVDRLGGADLFFDPVHAEIFTIICDKCRNGDLADPVTVGLAMTNHSRLAELGGRRYLVRLAGASPGRRRSEVMPSPCPSWRASGKSRAQFPKPLPPSRAPSRIWWTT